jgi:hypothetical protein
MQFSRYTANDPEEPAGSLFMEKGKSLYAYLKVKAESIL